MKLKSIYKPENGKLIKIELEKFEDQIKNITICGDFFMHPEEMIKEIEAELISVEIDEIKLVANIEKTIQKNKIELFGVTAKDLSHAILMAKENISI